MRAHRLGRYFVFSPWLSLLQDAWISFAMKVGNQQDPFGLDLVIKAIRKARYGCSSAATIDGGELQRVVFDALGCLFYCLDEALGELRTDVRVPALGA